MKRRHADCQIVKRKGTLYVICKSNPKFKARQGATAGTRLSKKGRQVIPWPSTDFKKTAARRVPVFFC